MNKKPYIAPAIELIDMESTAVIAASGDSYSVDVSETEIPVEANPRTPRRFWSSADGWDIE